MKTQDFHVFRKNSAVACRGTTSRAKVARQKLNEGPYEASRREFQAQLEGVKTTAQQGSTPATSREMTRCAKVAWPKEIACISKAIMAAWNHSNHFGTHSILFQHQFLDTIKCKMHLNFRTLIKEMYVHVCACYTFTNNFRYSEIPI
jgi:hypothetical protein